ncbi:MAG: hypothetical protein DRN20_03170 [Thermoplasmata archaeon]|nr:MAG: hypothetical protein DRN20_03170 [Thermoplasmata archaeon]
MNWGFVISAFSSIFVVVNPITKLIYFPLITQGFTREEKVEIITIAVYVSFSILMGFAILGRYVFMALGVRPASLHIVGAIILLKMGYDMIQGQIPRTKTSDKEISELSAKKDVGIVPLAIPMISGPGSIVTVITFMSIAPGVWEAIMVLAAIAVICLITLFMLIFAEVISEKVGRIACYAMLRIMGIIGLAVGVQMFVDGTDMLLRQWGILK